MIDANIVSDSGAFTNYVNASFAESLGRDIQNVSAQTGTGADGNKIIATKAVDIPVLIAEGIIKTDRYYLLDGLPQTFIVGKPTLRRWKAELDLEDGTTVLKR